MSSNKQATQPLRGAPCKLQVSLRVRTECGCETPAICPAQAHKESEDWNRQDERTLLWLDPRVPEKFRRRPKPLPFPAGLGSPPPLAAAPSLACAVPDPEIRLGLRALARTGLGPAGLGLRAPPRLSPPPVGRSRRAPRGC